MYGSWSRNRKVPVPQTVCGDCGGFLTMFSFTVCQWCLNNLRNTRRIYIETEAESTQCIYIGYSRFYVEAILGDIH
uniref:SFRICE_030740 n=1 Tax=Spodoptera frugiperda TaxID=7108 RepID=A0A2H1W0Z8_SPOFR